MHCVGRLLYVCAVKQIKCNNMKKENVTIAAALIFTISAGGFLIALFALLINQ